MIILDQNTIKSNKTGLDDCGRPTERGEPWGARCTQQRGQQGGTVDGRPDLGDLTLIKQSYKKKRYVVLFSAKEGRSVCVDQFKARYDRMRKRIKAWADVLGTMPGARLVMIGLTYRPGEDYRPNDIRDFMTVVKRKLGKKLLGYAWVAEMQGRGAVHYHVVLHLAKGAHLPLPDKSGWWKHGSTKISKAKSPYYLVAYTKKACQKDYDKFPKGIRSYAVWIREDLMRERLRYLNLRYWERAYVDMYGWEELPFWRRHEKGLSDWRVGGIFSELEAAEERTEYWLDVILTLDNSPPPYVPPLRRNPRPSEGISEFTGSA